jgi:hypothetical protein
MPRKPFRLGLWAVFLLGPSAAAATVQLAPTKDNTLFQQANPAAQLSNGQGDLFVGRTGQEATISIRRGLVAFDVAGSIPAGSIITGVTLALREGIGMNGDRTVELHRVLQDWGEGASFHSGGLGAPAQNNDATWLYRFYDFANPGASPAWSSPGGDFSAAASASTVVSDDLGAGQVFTWSSAQMLADVQDWLDNPLSNFGWILVGDESAAPSAKRFASGETATPPALGISYVVPEPSGLLLVAAGSALPVLAGARRRRTR